MYCIIQFIVWKLPEFPALVDDLHSYSLQLPTKGFKLVFSISAQKYSNCSKFSEISSTGMAIFAISLLLFDDFPKYSGYSSQIH